MAVASDVKRFSSGVNFRITLPFLRISGFGFRNCGRLGSIPVNVLSDFGLQASFGLRISDFGLLPARCPLLSTLKQPHLNKRPSPYVAALIAVLLWGVSFVASKAALRDISPITLLFTRFAIGTAILSAVVHLHGNPVLPPRDTWPTLALMGFVGVFAHHMLQASG